MGQLTVILTIAGTWELLVRRYIIAERFVLQLSIRPIFAVGRKPLATSVTVGRWGRVMIFLVLGHEGRGQGARTLRTTDTTRKAAGREGKECGGKTEEATRRGERRCEIDWERSRSSTAQCRIAVLPLCRSTPPSTSATAAGLSCADHSFRCILHYVVLQVRTAETARKGIMITIRS